MSRTTALIALARPAGAVWVLMLPLLGYGFAHWDGAYAARGSWQIVALCGAWLALHAGTLWLNAALDHDDDDVLWGGAVAVPDIATWAGGVALALCVVLSSLAGPVAGLCGLACALLAVLYSHPRTVWKGHLVLGAMVNAVGYGLLSPIAGWSVVGVEVTPRALAALAVLLLWVSGAYLLAQSFQADADRERGYRTFVVVCGVQTTLSVTFVLLRAGVFALAMLSLIGWFPRVVLAVGPLWIWVEMSMRAQRPSAHWANTVFSRVGWFGLAVVAAALTHQLWALVADGPTAGLATARGWPQSRLEVRERRLVHQEQRP